MSFSELELNLKAFKPILPIWTAHTQTLLGHIIPSDQIHGELKNFVLKLSDGDELFLEFIDRKSKFTLSLFHGLGGNGNSDYVRRSANLALSLDWNVVLVHHRLVHEKAHASRSYHSGRGDDAEAVVIWSRNRFPNSQQVALGFSMSGSILFNLLAKRYGTEQPDFAICVNGPLDLKGSADLLTKGFSKIYDIRFYFLLKKLIQKNEDFKMPRWGRTVDIDLLYTARKNGFLDYKDYYAKCSAGPFVKNITTKTFVLTSKDDPFVDFDSYKSAAWPDCVHRTFVQSGGHMGYISKNRIEGFGHRWLDYYLANVLTKIQRDLKPA